MTFIYANCAIWNISSKFPQFLLCRTLAHSINTGDMIKRLLKGSRYLWDSDVSAPDAHHLSCVCLVRWLTARPSCCWLRPTSWRSWASSWDPPSRSPTPFSCLKAQTRDWSDPPPFTRSHHLVPKSFGCREEEKKKEKPWTLFFHMFWCPVPIREREKERGNKKNELGQRDIFLSNREIWKTAWPDWYGSWMERWKSACFYRVGWFFKQMLWYLITDNDLKMPLSTCVQPPASGLREWNYWRWWCWTVKLRILPVDLSLNTSELLSSICQLAQIIPGIKESAAKFHLEPSV